MDLRVDLQHSLTCDEAPRSHAPVVFKFPRDEQVLDDWFVCVTAIASHWLPLLRPVIRAEIKCLAHPRTTGTNASCIACIGIAKHLATSRVEPAASRASPAPRYRGLARRDNQAAQRFPAATE
jgi:hypothetical protein